MLQAVKLQESNRDVLKIVTKKPGWNDEKRDKMRYLEPPKNMNKYGLVKQDEEQWVVRRSGYGYMHKYIVYAFKSHIHTNITYTVYTWLNSNISSTCISSKNQEIPVPKANNM